MKRTSIGTVLIALATLPLGERAALAQTESRGVASPTRSWSLTLTCTADDCPRFVLLPNFSGQICDTVIFLCAPGPVAVLDRETGLVWERIPGATRGYRRQAASACHSKDIGGRKGWRLPTISELATLVDPGQSNPALPEGHPFNGVRFGPGAFQQWYWSSSAFPEEVGLLIPPFPVTVDTEVMNMATGSTVTAHSTGSRLMTWCVRGGR
jgi:hypothetical protein